MYLGLLREKVNQKYSDVKVDDIVFIDYENFKRLGWPLAFKILEVFPRKYEIVRLVRIITANNKILLRPLQRLYFMLEGKLDQPSKI